MQNDDAAIKFGAALDTALYRTPSGRLRTDKGFDVGGGVSFSGTNTISGVLFANNGTVSTPGASCISVSKRLNQLLCRPCVNWAAYHDRADD